MQQVDTSVKEKKKTKKLDKNRAVIKAEKIENVSNKDLSTKLRCLWYVIYQAATFEHPTTDSDGFQSNTLRYFIENCQIKVKKLDEEEIIFDLIGVDAPLANALRRILIAEVPTMAIEKVDMWQNTSVIPDENLAHRLGLVPILADPTLFDYREPGAAETPKNSIRFKLHAICTRKN